MNKYPQVYTAIGPVAPDGLVKWQPCGLPLDEALKKYAGNTTINIVWADESGCMNSVIIYSNADGGTIADLVASKIVNRFAGIKFHP